MPDPGRDWPLVGRAAELDDLETLLTDATDAAGGVLLLEGEAGVGKTSLVDALRSGAQLLGIEDAAGRESTQIGAAPTDGRARLVVLEDLQDWPDDALDALTAAAREGVAARTLVVLTLRPVPHRDAVVRGVSGWTRAGAQHLELRPLAPAAAAELAEAILGASLGPSLRGAVATAGGNPRFVVDVVTAARDSGALAPVEGGIDAVVHGWRAVVEQRVRGRLGYLDDDVRDLLAVASVLGVSFVVVDLAAVVGRPVPDVWRTLRHALAAGVVQARGDRLVFRHDVVRAALYGGIGPDERRELHARAAFTLREAGAPQAVVATHLERAR
jgi:predicted ATPase